MPNLFDIHCHLNLPEFSEDREAVLGRTLEAGCWLVNVGADLASSKFAVEIAETEEEGAWATAGFHPTETVESFDENWEELKTLARNSRVVAVGECGLEYFRIKNEELRIKNEQKRIFRDHIELALLLGKPLMIHCRSSQGSQDAYDDLLNILGEYKQSAGEKLCGDMHFFAGNWETAKRCLDLGFTLSFTGVITFTSQYDEVIKNAPLDMIMAETDAPFVAPVPYRGKRCEPLYVAEVVKRLAELKGLSVEKMAEITVGNGRKLYGV